MKAARLYGPRDIRIDQVAEPRTPQAGEVLLAVRAVGVCGSDLHMVADGRIGDTAYDSPLVLGHEFMGEVLAVGADAADGWHRPLQVGQRVAVDPACPCRQCEACEHGHPNLCPHHTFYGVYPTDGALQERMIVHAQNCFPIPDALNDDEGVLLEPLGVAIHALDLAHLKIAHSVAIIGCGPIGLLILRLAKLAGAGPIYATDCFPWRVELARAWGATAAWTVDDGDPVERLMALAGGRGVDVAIEAAWAEHSIQQAADMALPGGRLVLVGIPGDDRLVMQHSTARRKGLTILLARRMKHTYPRAIQLALAKDQLALADLVSHRFCLDEVNEAFRRNLAYETGLQKVIITL
ncbi:MAG: alcohol dehydrogenase catalytic domain-containing protein [Chloroflexi bacterium]|nr:alcohol dehydrogenase catalytic domain-containing protein [Chloroflexota bacterium]